MTRSQLFSLRPILTIVFVIVAGAQHTHSRADDFVPDEDVRPTYFEDLPYPLAARLKHISGVVVVKAVLDENGNVSSAQALSGARALVPDCVSSAKKWRFRPGRASSVIIVYRFVISGLCNLPCKSQFEFEPPNFAVVRTGEPVLDHGPEPR